MKFILKGCSETKGLIDLADTVTAMTCVRLRYGLNGGIPDQEGVERF